MVSITTLKVYCSVNKYSFMFTLLSEESQEMSEKQLMERNKKLRQHTAAFLFQLTKCLSTCKKEVYSLSPKLVRPSVAKLREAVDNALYVAERVKRVSISSTSTLKRLTQTAATISRLVHIPDSMHSAVTRSSYHCLLRIRRFLNLAIRVASVLHAYTEKMVLGDSAPHVKEGKVSTHESHRKEKDGGMELVEQSQSGMEEKSIPPTYWKPSLNIPFFLKPATLVYKRSLPNELMMNTLKEKLGCHPPEKIQGAQMVVDPSTGKECSFDKTCKDLRDTLNSDLKPQKLIVSLPLFKLPSSQQLGQKRSASMLPELHPPPPPSKFRLNSSCRQLVLDDVVDVGVVKGNTASTQGSNYNVEIGEMINDLLWKVRREVVAKQSIAKKSSAVVSPNTPLKGVKKQSTFKPTRQNRFSPYAGRSVSKKVPLSNGSNKTMQLKCTLSKAQSFAPGQRRDIIPEQEPSTAIKPPHSKLSNKTEQLKYTLSIAQPWSAPLKQNCKLEISMDQLAALFENKCYPAKLASTVITLSKSYSRLSFKDPHRSDLKPSMAPKEQLPGLALQDGGVKFILRASPLTPVLQHRKAEGKDLNILPKNFQRNPHSDLKLSGGGVKFTLRPSPLTPVVAKLRRQFFTTVVQNAIEVVMKRPSSKAILRPTRRRVHSNPSNELAARKNPRYEYDSVSESEDYRGLIGANVEVLTVNETEERPRKVRLGKVD